MYLLQIHHYFFKDGDGRDIIVVGAENWPPQVRETYMAMMKTALMTTWGQAVYDYYANSQTDDVYITVADGVFKYDPNAIAMTTNVNLGAEINGRFDIVMKALIGRIFQYLIM